MALNVPQAHHRTLLYQLCVRAVLEEDGIYYDDLVDILAYNVEEGEAVAIIQRRRRREINETDRDAVTSGKRYVARAIIDRAHRYGRITYLDTQDGRSIPRKVLLGTPPTGGGPAGKTRTWDDEREATRGAAARVLDRTRAQLG